MFNKLNVVYLPLLIALISILSCGDMNEIQREFADRDERVYLGKVDSIKSIPGFGRTKITWHIGSDPKIEQTIIYWNLREDSIVKDFLRTTPGLQRDSIIIEDLPEGSTIFEFRNINSRGETSLFTSATVTVWGGNFAEGLRARTLTSTIFDYEQSKYIIELSPASMGDSVVYSQIVYTDKTGKEKKIRIERETNKLELDNFQDGSEFHLRNIFFLPLGMDTVFSIYKTVKAPSAVFEQGRKITFEGDPKSSFFGHNSTSFYEWKQTDDLILHELGENGSYMQIESHPGLVPNNIYRDFFFYDDDKFIGVGINNYLYMLIIENESLSFIKSGTNNHFGTGFAMPKFLPGRGFFYVITDAGAMNAWYINNNASWGNPNNSAVCTNFLYDPFTLFDNNFLVTIDAEGFLWSIPISSTGLHRGLNKIGSGWSKFVKLITVGQKLIAMTENGDFYEFDFNATDFYWVL